MKQLTFSLCFYFLLIATFSYSQDKKSSQVYKSKSSATINGATYVLHVVEKGQTLFAIAKFYKKDINEIVRENPEAINGIRPGQVLRIQTGKAKEATTVSNDTSHCFTHTIEKGETIYSLTKKYTISAELLERLNPQIKEGGIQQGQVLRIPLKKANNTTNISNNVPTVSNDTSSFRMHTVEKRETIYSITKKYNISSEQLERLNPEMKDGLKVGQVIKLPSLSAQSKVVNASEIPLETENKTDTIIYKGEFKKEYNIAFFLPFNLGPENSVDVDKILNGAAELPYRTSIALQFYEGALLAIDSLKKQKMNAKIFVFDVDDKDSSNLGTLLKKPELAKMDLIIGPLYGSSFMPVAKFAKANMIPIVSPFTQLNKILFNNPYVCKVSPSTVLQVEKIAHYVVDTFKNENIILVNSMNARYAAFFDAFRKTANDDLITAGKAISDSLKILYNVNVIESVLSSTTVNVIALPSNDQPYVSDFISKLHMLDEKYKIVLIGMQNWIQYDNMDYEYLNKISLHVPSNGFVDYSTTASKMFIKKYQDRYKADPDIYGFQGYDVTYYFLSTLQKFGGGFLNTIKDRQYTGIETSFHFTQFPADSGFENQSVLILKYQNYQLIKALK